MRIFLSATVGACASLLVACGSSDSGTTTDPDSSATGDTAAVDSAKGDTATDTTTGDTTTADVAPTDGVADTSGGPCGPDKTCAAGEVCTRQYTTGGACFSCADDAAACGTGTHCSGSCCVADAVSYSYDCKTPPGACGSAATCTGACGNALCGGGSICEGVADGVVTCHQLAP